MTIFMTILYAASIVGFVSFAKSLLTFEEDVSRFDRILLAFMCGLEAVASFNSIVKFWS